MKKIFYVALMAVAVMFSSCQQSKEDYIKEFKSFVEEVSDECADYTEDDWKDAAKEFEALVEQAKQYEDFTAEEMVEIAAIQAKYAGIQAKKGINKVIDGVKDLFGGKKDKK